jgi:hypothetical protein
MISTRLHETHPSTNDHDSVDCNEDDSHNDDDGNDDDDSGNGDNGNDDAAAASVAPAATPQSSTVRRTSQWTMPMMVSSIAIKMKRKIFTKTKIAHAQPHECRASHAAQQHSQTHPQPSWPRIDGQSPTGSLEHDVTTTLLDNHAFLSSWVSLLPSTSHRDILDTLDRLLQRERKCVYEPPPGKAMVIVLDDLHVLPPHNEVCA